MKPGDMSVVVQCACCGQLGDTQRPTIKGGSCEARLRGWLQFEVGWVCPKVHCKAMAMAAAEQAAEQAVAS